MIAMAPRAAGSVGHVPHAGGAAARLFGGIIWLETEGHASLMRSRRALGPARAPFFGTFGAVFSPVSYLNLAHFCGLSGTELLWTIEALCRTGHKNFARRGRCGAENRPKRAKEGRSRGAKCASAAHEGGVPLGFQPDNTPG